jgi:hypothetical protein
MKVLLKGLSLIQTGEPAGTRTHGSCTKPFRLFLLGRWESRLLLYAAADHLDPLQPPLVTSDH